jgi:hypothetical protein
LFIHSGADREELNDLIEEVALHGRIEVEKLLDTISCLSGVHSREASAYRAASYDARGKPKEPDAEKSGLVHQVYDVRKMLKRFEARRLGLVLQISDEVAILENYIYAIGEQYPDVRSELALIISEIAREPSVSSEYSDNGHLKLTLNCYAVYLERRLEIQHMINRDIERRFSSANIKTVRPLQKG